MSRYFEQVIFDHVIAMRKRHEAAPGRVRVSFDDFNGMVRRLGAKLESEGAGEREVTYIMLHTAAGRIRVQPCSSLQLDEYRIEPAPARFQVGDVVHLKTGGPKMTVESFGLEYVGADKPASLDIGRAAHFRSDANSARCVWFVKTESGSSWNWTGPHRSTFDVEVLELDSNSHSTQGDTPAVDPGDTGRT